MTDLNHVSVTGTLARDPIVTWTDAGTQHTTFRLACVETNAAGEAFTLFVPVETYGQAADAAGALHAGTSVLISGKLRWTSWTDKQGQKRTSLCVLARLVKPLAPAPAAAPPPAQASAPLGWPQPGTAAERGC
jgi:single stranded DNA-binding protein